MPGRASAEKPIVGDVRVRAPSVDVRTVGSGWRLHRVMSPSLTKALRVGPESAGAVPGPACYMKGGEATHRLRRQRRTGVPTVGRAAGRRYAHQPRRVGYGRGSARSPTPWALSLMEAAEGIIKIVNESMFGALRLVSVEQGYDPRDFALVGFGGAGPLHANALGILTDAWPVIVPPGPGVLCAYGDATTQVQDEAARTYLTMAGDLSDDTN